MAIGNHGCMDVAYSAIGGFWSGWLAGSTILAVGKAWTLLTNSSQKVSQLLGHIGTPRFRRELAIGLAIYGLTFKIFQILGEKLRIEPDSLSERTYQILTQAISIAIASFAASSATYSQYHYMLYFVGAVSAAFIAKITFDSLSAPSG